MNTRLMLVSSVRVLARYKLRSFLMSLGIVVGVAALVVMRSMGAGAEQEMRERVGRMFSASSIYITNSSSESARLTIEDMEAISDQLEQVVAWDPAVVASSREVRFGGSNRNLTVWGHSERAESVHNRGVVDGEFFSRADVSSAARVALIGTKTAAALFADESPVGQQIQIDGVPFRVKGVLEEHGTDPHGVDRDDEVHIPISTSMRRLLNVDRISYAKLLVSSAEEVEQTADQIAEILQVRHGIAIDEADDFTIFTPIGVQKLVEEANRVLTVYLPATAGIALLVAAIVITNIMLIGVRERTAEIGLRKAVGATSGQISGQFLLESLAVTVLSGALGVAIAAAVLATVATTMGMTARIAPDAILLGLVAALGVGILAGVLPARQAAGQEPVDALR